MPINTNDTVRALFRQRKAGTIYKESKDSQLLEFLIESLDTICLIADMVRGKTPTQLPFKAAIVEPKSDWTPKNTTQPPQDTTQTPKDTTLTQPNLKSPKKRGRKRKITKTEKGRLHDASIHTTLTNQADPTGNTKPHNTKPTLKPKSSKSISLKLGSPHKKHTTESRSPGHVVNHATGTTLLQEECERGSLVGVETLLNNITYSALNKSDYTGDTALHYAIKNRQASCAMALLEHPLITISNIAPDLLELCGGTAVMGKVRDKVITLTISLAGRASKRPRPEKENSSENSKVENTTPSVLVNPKVTTKLVPRPKVFQKFAIRGRGRPRLMKPKDEQMPTSPSVAPLSDKPEATEATKSSYSGNIFKQMTARMSSERGRNSKQPLKPLSPIIRLSPQPISSQTEHPDPPSESTPSEDLYVICSQCQASFPSVLQHDEHKKTVHGELIDIPDEAPEASQQCTFCQLNFKNEEQLLKHQVNFCKMNADSERRKSSSSECNSLIKSVTSKKRERISSREIRKRGPIDAIMMKETHKRRCSTGLLKENCTVCHSMFCECLLLRKRPAGTHYRQKQGHSSKAGASSKKSGYAEETESDGKTQPNKAVEEDDRKEKEREGEAMMTTTAEDVDDGDVGNGDDDDGGDGVVVSIIRGGYAVDVGGSNIDKKTVQALFCAPCQKHFKNEHYIEKHMQQFHSV